MQNGSYGSKNNQSLEDISTCILANRGIEGGEAVPLMNALQNLATPTKNNLKD